MSKTTTRNITKLHRILDDLNSYITQPGPITRSLDALNETLDLFLRETLTLNYNLHYEIQDQLALDAAPPIQPYGSPLTPQDTTFAAQAGFREGNSPDSGGR